MIKVKICGIRRPEDIEYVNRCKPDYIGFVFAESKRRVDIETVKKLILPLDREIKKTGVFVNENTDNILKTVEECGLNVIQLHGDETDEAVAVLKKRISRLGPGNDIEIWKAVRVKDISSLKQMEESEADAFLLDAFIEGSYGGAGTPFDWNLAREGKKFGKVILAGGLNTQNICEAVRKVLPYGVDTSSGVETAGYKDEEKIREFVYKARKN